LKASGRQKRIVSIISLQALSRACLLILMVKALSQFAGVKATQSF